MITIKIVMAERRDGDINARWITDQVERTAQRREKVLCVI